jgi:nucleoid DNA-binding protein
MPTDLNDVDALIANLVDAFRKAVIKGIKVRVDENGEMFVTHKDAERAHVSATGVTAEIDGEKVVSKPPFSDLLRGPGETEDDAEKRMLGDDAGA